MLFFLGVEHTKDDRRVLISNPLKALFDLIYYRKTNYADLNDLKDDLRIDVDSLNTFVAEYSYKEMELLAASYRKRNIMRFFQLLVRELK